MNVTEIADDIRDLVDRGRDYEAAEWEATKDLNLSERRLNQVRDEYFR